MSTQKVRLLDQTPFSKGGNRLCYVHPEHTNRCLKVLIESSAPEIKRKEKGFPASLRSLETFDENLQEYITLSHMWAKLPQLITLHLPRSYGIVETDRGAAHEITLIRDGDGQISQTLEQYLWKRGVDQTITNAIEQFHSNWSAGVPNTRALLPHNFVVQHAEGKAMLVLIDGYGRADKWPLPSFWRKQRTRSQLKYFAARIETVLERKKNNETPKPRILALNRNA